MIRESKTPSYTEIKLLKKKGFALTLYQTTKVWTCPNWKAFAENNINVTHKLRFALGRVEKIVGKGKNAGSQHFVLFPQYFQKATFSGSSKVKTVYHFQFGQV